MNEKLEMFTKFGNRIFFQSLPDLNKKLSSIDTRIINDTNLERERSNIVRYLSTLGNHNFFHYPLEVEYIDLGSGAAMPGFLIDDNGYEYYLEVSVATKTELIDQIKGLDDAQQIEFNILIDGEEIKVESYESQKDDKGNYYPACGPASGDMQEVICGKILAAAIIYKTEQLAKYEIDRDKDTELLLCYNFPLQAGLNWGPAIGYAYKYLSDRRYSEMKVKFDRIGIMNDSMLIYRILNISGVGLSII